jgi:hypothetical protein
MYSVLPKTVAYQDGSFRGARDVDPVVHPSQRGQGLFGRLLIFGLENFQDLDFLFNFANPASAKGFRRGGWRDAPPLEDCVRQLGFDKPISQAGLLRFLGCLQPHRGPSFRTRPVSEDEFRDMLSENSRFATPTSPPGRAGVERTADFLAWRYLDHPNHRYRFFLAEGTDGGVAVAVCRHDERSGLLSVVDLAGFGIDPPLTTWEDDWKQQFPRARAVAWRTLPAGNLKGFIRKPLNRGRGQTFLTREFPGGEAPFELTDTGKWYLTRGDLEIS